MTSSDTEARRRLWFLARRAKPRAGDFAPRPRTLWIELTSKCPFDCVFCSRRLLRGSGLHMDMALYQRILEDLDEPEIIRLNYSGESTHHPHLVEAVRLASATGAATELVTALASLPDRLIPDLATSGLDRLTLSLHTMDPQQYRQIYGYGSIDAVRRKVASLIAARDAAGAPGPTLDIAVVAMRRNLSELPAIAAFAEDIGATGLAIHPVIRRDPIAERFEAELDGERLRPEFLADLDQALAAVRTRHPDLALSVSTPEIAGAVDLGARPIPYPWTLPAHAHLHSCDQSPWDTVHILADGAVVTCEVRDRVVMGRISNDPAGPSLGSIWQGAAYEAFRAQFRAGAAPECRTCPYKSAYEPGPDAAGIDAAQGAHAQLILGWHPPDGSGLLWAKRRATLRLARSAKARRLCLKGVVPTAVGQVKVVLDGRILASIGGGPDPWVNLDLALPRGSRSRDARIELIADRALIPARQGLGPDVRELGFGLASIELV